MSQVVSVFKVLKNTDLHALSALEAVQRYLGYPNLKALRRIQLWEVGVDQVSDAQKILSTTFYLLNPNKETYTLGRLAESKMKAGERRFRIKVLDKEPEDLSHLISKISQKTNVTVRSLNRFLLWEMSVVDPREEDDIRRELAEKVVVSSSRTKGLLINPVTQDFEWISASS